MPCEYSCPLKPGGTNYAQNVVADSLAATEAAGDDESIHSSVPAPTPAPMSTALTPPSPCVGEPVEEISSTRCGSDTISSLHCWASESDDQAYAERLAQTHNGDAEHPADKMADEAPLTPASRKKIKRKKNKHMKMVRDREAKAKGTQAKEDKAEKEKTREDIFVWSQAEVARFTQVVLCIKNFATQVKALTVPDATKSATDWHNPKTCRYSAKDQIKNFKSVLVATAEAAPRMLSIAFKKKMVHAKMASSTAEQLVTALQSPYNAVIQQLRTVLRADGCVWPFQELLDAFPHLREMLAAGSEVLTAAASWVAAAMVVQLRLIKLAVLEKTETCVLFTSYSARVKTVRQLLGGLGHVLGPMTMEEGADMRIERLLNGQPCWPVLV